MGEPNPNLTFEQRMKMLMYCMGTINGIHDNVDKLREGFDPRNRIDHSIEQAQIHLESAFLRLQQVVTVLEDREEEEKVDDDHEPDGD